MKPKETADMKQGKKKFKPGEYELNNAYKNKIHSLMRNHPTSPFIALLLSELNKLRVKRGLKPYEPKIEPKKIPEEETCIICKKKLPGKDNRRKHTCSGNCARAYRRVYTRFLNNSKTLNQLMQLQEELEVYL